jgi:hypothetical protein
MKKDHRESQSTVRTKSSDCQTRRIEKYVYCFTPCYSEIHFNIILLMYFVFKMTPSLEMERNVQVVATPAS